MAWLLEVTTGEDEGVHGDDGDAREGVDGDEDVVAEVSAAGLGGVLGDGGEERVEEKEEGKVREEEEGLEGPAWVHEEDGQGNVMPRDQGNGEGRQGRWMQEVSTKKKIKKRI